MTNSDSSVDVQAVLDSILLALDEDYIHENIDVRIDKAASSLEIPRAQICSQREFLEIVGKCVLQVYRDGLAVPQNLTADQARAEAVELLERWYVGRNVSGYHAALVEGLSPGVDGIALVLAALGEIIRARERDKYVRWAKTCLSHLCVPGSREVARRLKSPQT